MRFRQNLFSVTFLCLCAVYKYGRLSRPVYSSVLWEKLDILVASRFFFSIMNNAIVNFLKICFYYCRLDSFIWDYSVKSYAVLEL